ncbi:MAG: hypothetical protein J0J06_12705 [Sphingomonas sp.]|uniref:hypothetical protein n=1 Tax=Sphingomonas sp. TaxID=28214 RepID=UPI001AC79181|nr:hypothetical protein [Sphingomonas sp.]MBN8816292.1 hypothetical protein [Sphingomonas sp.]
MAELGATHDGSESGEKVSTVAGAVLTTFFDALAKTDDLADIAANLKKLVLADGVFAEPAVRATLFPDAP